MRTRFADQWPLHRDIWAEEDATSLRYWYRTHWQLPLHDPRLDVTSDEEIYLDYLTYQRYRRIVARTRVYDTALENDERAKATSRHKNDRLKRRVGAMTAEEQEAAAELHGPAWQEIIAASPDDADDDAPVAREREMTEEEMDDMLDMIPDGGLSGEAFARKLREGLNP